MYITEVLTKTKKGQVSHRCVLLRESYRDKKDGKVKSKTLANLTYCKKEEIQAMKLALKHKNNLQKLGDIDSSMQIKEGVSIGAVFLIYNIAKKIGIEKALGTSVNGKIALWQVIARLICQGSRLSAIRLAQSTTACEVLNIKKDFCEDDLYKNLAWLSENQLSIEKKLLNSRYKNKKPQLFLYDVTSSYFEGQYNEMADYGYNRDQKKSKKQIVMGLLCDTEGVPISIEVFKGNTNDTKTFKSQIQKTAQNFGCEKVIFVGDGGMIKSTQIADLNQESFFYISSISKKQIQTLIKKNLIQLELFDNNLFEVKEGDTRYIARRNPVRANELKQMVLSKENKIQNFIQKQNQYLEEHSKAKTKTAEKNIIEKITKLKLNKWITIHLNDRCFTMKIDVLKKQQATMLDGCYMLKTNVSEDMAKEDIHDRYKDLAKVEKNFKICKTGHLEMRPWFVRTEESTRGCALITMLASIIRQELEKIWIDFDLTVEEGIMQLATLSTMEITLNTGVVFYKIPEPKNISKELFKTADIDLPKALPKSKTIVVSRKKLNLARKPR